MASEYAAGLVSMVTRPDSIAPGKALTHSIFLELHSTLGGGGRGDGAEGDGSIQCCVSAPSPYSTSGFQLGSLCGKRVRSPEGEPLTTCLQPHS